MASEEIRVNEALEAAGIRPVECDLGEYILQLAQEHPIHIILPAIEKTARPMSPSSSPRSKARLSLLSWKSSRPPPDGSWKVFLSAEVGLTGANFAVSENRLPLSRYERGQRGPGDVPAEGPSPFSAWSAWCRPSTTSPCCSSSSLAAPRGRS